MVAIRILQPLGSNHPFVRTRDSAISMVTSPTTVKDLIIEACRSTTTAMELYVHSHPPSRDYSCMILAALYTPAITLTSYLHDHFVHVMFNSNVVMLKYVSRRFAAARLMLQGLRALAWFMKMPIPEQAKACFEGLEDGAHGREDLRDVPTQVALPQYEEIRDILSDDGPDQTDMAYHLGMLISKWSAMSLS